VNEDPLPRSLRAGGAGDVGERRRLLDRPGWCGRRPRHGAALRRRRQHQIGDLSAFFLSIAPFVALAQRRGAGHWLLPAAVLLGGAAVARTLTAAVGHAPFTAQFIVPEVIMATILIVAARLRRDEADAG
jgi:hypothetical protein